MEYRPGAVLQPWTAQHQYLACAAMQKYILGWVVDGIDIRGSPTASTKAKAGLS